MMSAEHFERHRALDVALAELVDDYLAHSEIRDLGAVTVLELVDWSRRKTFELENATAALSLSLLQA